MTFVIRTLYTNNIVVAGCLSGAGMYLVPWLNYINEPDEMLLCKFLILVFVLLVYLYLCGCYPGRLIV